jgi:hypothetical protein
VIRLMILVTAIVLALLGPSGSFPGPASEKEMGSPEIRFSFEHPQLDPSAYTLVIHEDGSGHYQSSPGPNSGPGVDGYGAAASERDITIRDPLLATLFQTARSHRFFAMDCEAADAHIAFTGKKTVAYAGSDGSGQCSYNWSRDKELNQLAENLMAVAYTLYEGNRLAIEHEHSRLSLDSELGTLQDAVKDHRALEIENIAPVLEAIAADPAVMNRARNRARALLNGETSKH